MVCEGIIISDLVIQLQLGTADCGSQCQMGCVFINLITVMLCIVAFEYFNQKRKVVRRMYGYYLEYFLYTECKVENLIGKTFQNLLWDIAISDFIVSKKSLKPSYVPSYSNKELVKG